MEKPIEKLKDRIFGNKAKAKITELTNIFDMIREFGCFGEIVGRDFEVRDPNGILVYTIKQKPITLKQLNHFLKEFEVIKRLDAEREAAKWDTKKGRGIPGLNKRRR